MKNETLEINGLPYPVESWALILHDDALAYVKIFTYAPATYRVLGNVHPLDIVLDHEWGRFRCEGFFMSVEPQGYVLNGEFGTDVSSWLITAKINKITIEKDVQNG